MDAHDGSIQKFSEAGPYYYHAASYGLCAEPVNHGCDRTPLNCGFRYDHNISIWSSPDLSSGSWTYEGNSIAIADRPAGIVYRPHAIYNPTTQMYVLWWNNMLDITPSVATYVSAYSKSPTGPFQVGSAEVNIGTGGDFALFVDDDGTAYGLFGAWMCYNHIRIFQLTPDYLNVTNTSYTFETEEFVEAPVMLKRNGWYYAIFDWCCCFCLQGSGVRVYASKSPLGPYTQQTEASGDLACVPWNGSIPTDKEKIFKSTHSSQINIGADWDPNEGCQHNNVSTTSITRAQQNYIIQADTPTGTQYIWTGDRWQQAPDGIKGHDPQYYYPLAWDDTQNPPTLGRLYWIDNFTVDVV